MNESWGTREVFKVPEKYTWGLLVCYRRHHGMKMENKVINEYPEHNLHCTCFLSLVVVF